MYLNRVQIVLSRTLTPLTLLIVTIIFINVIKIIMDLDNKIKEYFSSFIKTMKLRVSNKRHRVYCLSSHRRIK